MPPLTTEAPTFHVQPPDKLLRGTIAELGDPMVRRDKRGNVSVFVPAPVGHLDEWTPEEKLESLCKALGALRIGGGAAGSWTFYNSFREYVADGTIDLDTHVFKVLLTTSSYTPSAASHTQISDITNELSGSGYARYTLTATWTRSGATVTFDSDDATFTASGGSITARYAVIFDDTTTSPADALVCYCVLDSTPADVTVTDGDRKSVV